MMGIWNALDSWQRVEVLVLVGVIVLGAIAMAFLRDKAVKE